LAGQLSVRQSSNRRSRVFPENPHACLPRRHGLMCHMHPGVMISDLDSNKSQQAAAGWVGIRTYVGAAEGKRGGHRGTVAQRNGMPRSHLR
jgi:hypothetical protein